MKCTIEKLQNLQQLQITLHHDDTHHAPFTPMCAISNQFPYKPILRIQARDADGNQSPLIEIPLNVRVDLSDPKNHLSQSADSTIISLRIKQDLAEPEGEDDFPTARESSATEYSNIYCRHCGSSIFSPRTSPFRVNPLPSPYWAELTDLWFCHTSNNAHVDRIASTKIVVERGKLLIDKLLVRAHREDLVGNGESWRRHTSVQNLLQGLALQTQSSSSSSVQHHQADEHMSDVPELESVDASSSTSAAPKDIWSPLPCTGCFAVIGSILLTVSPSSNPSDAIRPSTSGEVRLWKYQLSNCFRRIVPSSSKIDADTNAGRTEETKEHIQDEMEVDTGNTRSSSHPTASASSAVRILKSPSCLCSTLAPSPLLTCSNMYLYYTFENFVTEDLLQRHNKQPIGKFLIESIDEEDETIGDERGQHHSTHSPVTKSKIFLRLFVSQWHLPLSSNVATAFPYTPQFGLSNSMVPVVKLDFAAHPTEDEAEMHQWIYGKKKGVTNASLAHGHSHSASDSSCSYQHSTADTKSVPTSPSSAAFSSFPSNIDRLYYSLSDCRTLLEILRARTEIWPLDSRSSTMDGTMQKSCLIKLTKAIKPMT